MKGILIKKVSYYFTDNTTLPTSVGKWDRISINKVTDYITDYTALPTLVGKCDRIRVAILVICLVINL